MLRGRIADEGTAVEGDRSDWGVEGCIWVCVTLDSSYSVQGSPLDCRTGQDGRGQCRCYFICAVQRFGCMVHT